MKYVFLLTAFLALVSCKNKDKDPDLSIHTEWEHNFQAISQGGDTLYAAKSSEEILAKFEEKKAAYEVNPNNLDNLIWYGRFAAYTGDYRKAIEIYSQGLEDFPKESRLLRHRGHRYISVREFDNAIADLSLAVKLIQGKENMIEEDGMPNDKNIPVSTMHGNIYYHLGLAYYLNRNLPAALEAYKKCLQTSNNPDNVVSATHWIYMIHRRMGRAEAAQNYLRNIHEDMNVIENQSYYKACLFYKGLLDLEDVYDPSAEGTPTNSALKYAVGNWYLYNGNPDQAHGIFNEIISGKDWASFGYIAAETDLAKPYTMR
ncbi:MAG: tetratricopeptide repeat protein [Bacteroidia bacterium]|nr:tetratricopeptide repeat protein [Bacteroidia bacterium]NNM22332.1 tetratricopeptide repeat protein [Flavobacteriaceae bacterium]